MKVQAYTQKLMGHIQCVNADENKEKKNIINWINKHHKTVIIDKYEENENSYSMSLWVCALFVRVNFPLSIRMITFFFTFIQPNQLQNNLILHWRLLISSWIFLSSIRIECQSGRLNVMSQQFFSEKNNLSSVNPIRSNPVRSSFFVCICIEDYYKGCHRNDK